MDQDEVNPIETLKSHGYSEEDVSAWKSDATDTFKQRGYSEEDISGFFQSPIPSMPVYAGAHFSKALAPQPLTGEQTKGFLAENKIPPATDIPTHGDFDTATAVLAGGSEYDSVKNSLMTLYNSRGIHPSNAAYEAHLDPIVYQSILSDGHDEAEHYDDRRPGWGILSEEERHEELQGRVRERANLSNKMQPALEAALALRQRGEPITPEVVKNLKGSGLSPWSNPKDIETMLNLTKKSIDDSAQFEQGMQAAPTKTAWRSMGENAIRSATDSVISIPEYAGILKGYLQHWTLGSDVEDEFLQRHAREAKDWTASHFPGDQARQNDFLQQLASTGGMVVGLYGPGGLAKLTTTGVAKLAGMSQAGMKVAGETAKGMTMVAGGAAATGAQGFEEATQSQHEAQQARETRAAVENLPGVSFAQPAEPLPEGPSEMERLAGTAGQTAVGLGMSLPIARAATGGLGGGSRVSRAAQASIEQGLAFPAYGAAGNWVAQQTYSPDRSIWEGMWEQSGIGISIGFLTGFASPGAPKPLRAREYTPEQLKAMMQDNPTMAQDYKQLAKATIEHGPDMPPLRDDVRNDLQYILDQVDPKLAGEFFHATLPGGMENPHPEQAQFPDPVPGAEVDPIAHLEAQLQSQIGHILPQSWALRVAASLGGGGTVNTHGMTDPATRTTWISAMAVDPKLVAREESGHAIRASGLFKAEEWRILHDAAVKNGWIDELPKEIQERYREAYADRGPDGARDAMVEETIMHRFAAGPEAWGPEGGAVSRLMHRIREMLERIGNMARGRGLQSADDVFRAMDTGKISARDTGEVHPERKGVAAYEGGGGGRDVGPPVGPMAGTGGGRPPSDAEIAQARRNILSRISIGEPDHGKGFSIEQLYKNFFDQFYYVGKAVKTVTGESASGQALPTEENPYHLIRMHPGAKGKVTAILNNGTFDWDTFKSNGKGLKEILAPVKDDLDGLRAFMVAARNMEKLNQGLETGVDPESSRIYGSASAAKYGQTMLELVDFQNRMLDYLVKSGIVSEDSRTAMQSLNKMYNPWHRVFGPDEHDGWLSSMGGGQNLTPRDPIKKFKGSERKIIDPLETIVKNVFTFVEMAERNMISDKLVAMLEHAQSEAEAAWTHAQKAGEHKAATPVEPTDVDFTTPPEKGLPGGMEKLEGPAKEPGLPMAYPHERAVELLPSEISPAEKEAATEYLKRQGVEPTESMIEMVAAEAKGPVAKGTIAVYRGGKRKLYRVDDELSSAIKGLDAPAIGAIEKFLAIPATTLRAGAVATPEFAFRHLFRSLFYTGVTMKNGLYNPKDIASSIFGLITKNDRYWEWMKSGGANIWTGGLDRDALQEKLDELTDKTGLATRTWNLVVDPETPWLTKGGAVMGLPVKYFSRYIIHPLQVLTELSENVGHFAGFEKEMARQEREFGGKITPDARGQLTGPASPAGLPPAAGREVARAPGAEVGGATQDGGVVRPDSIFMGNIGTEPTPSAGGASTSGLYKHAIQRAGWASRETGVDTRRIGAKMRALNMITAFSNIVFQDTDRIARAIKDDPVNTMMKIAVGISLPSALLWFANKDREDYKDLPEWQKRHFWHVYVDRPNGKVYDFRLPKPFSAGVLFGSGTEAALDRFFGDNPEAFKGFAASMTEATIPHFIPQALIPPIEQFSNRSTFFNKTLVPKAMEKFLPEYQYTEHTTQITKMIGQTIASIPGVRDASLENSIKGGFLASVTSPMIMENYIRGWTGGLGKHVLELLDYAAQKSGAAPEQNLPEQTLEDNWFLKSFMVRHPSASTQPIQDFQDEYARHEKYFDTWQAMAKAGDLEAVERIQKMGGEDNLIMLKGIHEALKMQYLTIRKTYGNQGVPPWQQREIIDQSYSAMNMFAKQGNLMMKAAREAADPE